MPSSHPRQDLALLYAASAAACLLVAPFLHFWGLLLLYPAVTLSLISFIYATGRADLFRKSNGRHPLPTRLLLYPYLIALRISWRLQSRHTPALIRLTPDLCIGRKLRPSETHLLHENNIATILDLTAELPAISRWGRHSCLPRMASGRLYPASPSHANPHSAIRTPQSEIQYLNLPLLDLAIPTRRSIRQALALIDNAPKPLFLHCALGCGRTPIIAAAYVLHTQQAQTPTQAIHQIKQRHPQSLFPPTARALLDSFTPLPAPRFSLLLNDDDVPPPHAHAHAASLPPSLPELPPP